jgi:hypothetical protein
VLGRLTAVDGDACASPRTCPPTSPRRIAFRRAILPFDRLIAAAGIDAPPAEPPAVVTTSRRSSRVDLAAAGTRHDPRTTGYRQDLG